MALSGIQGSGHQIRAAQAAYAVAAVKRDATRASTAEAPSRSTATAVRISDGGELLGKLQQLHDTSPSKFKRLMQDLAGETQAELQSKQARGEPSPSLNKLAAQLDEAAKDGNLTPLVPSLESARVARAQYQSEQDAFVAPSDAVKQLFRGFVDKVNAALPTASQGAGYAGERRAR